MSYTLELTESNKFRVKHLHEVCQVLEGIGFNTKADTDENIVEFTSDEEGVWFDEGAEVILSLKPLSKNIGVGENSRVISTNFVGVLSDWCDRSVEEYLEEYGLNESDVVIQPIIEYLQEELVSEKEYLSIVYSGSEGRSWGRYNPFGGATFITKNNVEWIDINRWVDNKVKSMKGIE